MSRLRCTNDQVSGLSHSGRGQIDQHGESRIDDVRSVLRRVTRVKYLGNMVTDDYQY